MSRTCEDTEFKCDWCDHNIYLNLHNKIKYYDIESQKEMLFCSYECKSKLLQDRVDVYYEVIESIYDKAKPFVETDSSSEED